MNPATMMTETELRQLGVSEDAGFGALETARGVLPLTALSVDARVVGLTATTEVVQTFVNPLAEPVEATYVFPLPDRAAATRFVMEVGGRVIEGVLDERGAARQAYDEAIAAGHRAAITEEDRPGVFSLRVGNLMPGDTATVRFTLTGPLPVDAGEATFRFPLVVAPRYIPGVPLAGPQAGLGTAPDTGAVPDASRITPPVRLPGMPDPVRLAIRLELDPAGLPLGEVRSSLHAVTGRGGDGAPVVLELKPGERLDRDFIVRWGVGGDHLATGLTWARDAEGEGASFVLTLVPPRLETAPRPRDVVFVVDHSGSMMGWKMVCARRAVARMVDTLGSADRFALLAFDDAILTPSALPAGLVPAVDRNRFRGVEFLAGLEAEGGTELAEPLSRAAQLLAAGGSGDLDRERVLVLVTDGQVGNEDQILRVLAPQLEGTRVFTLGIDQAVNAAFLRRLAAAGGGSCELCESEDRLDEVMDRVHRQLGTPVLTDLAVHGEGLRLEVERLTPARLPDVFSGAPVRIAGRLAQAPAPGAALVVHAQAAPGAKWETRVPVPAEPAGAGAAVHATWARGRIRDLEDRYAIGLAMGGALEALAREIVETSKGFSVLSRFTAFLAVDRSEVVNPGGGQRQVIQPVDAPAGWELQRDEEAADHGWASLAPVAAKETSLRHRRVSAKRAIPGAPPPAAPSAPLGSGGAVGKASTLGGDAGSAVYVRRAHDLADAFEAAGTAGDTGALEALLERLQALHADVVAAGQTIAGQQLEALLTALRQAAGAGALAPAAAGAAQALRALADAWVHLTWAPPPPRPGRLRRFWK